MSPLYHQTIKLSTLDLEALALSFGTTEQHRALPVTTAILPHLPVLSMFLLLALILDDYVYIGRCQLTSTPLTQTLIHIANEYK